MTTKSPTSTATAKPACAQCRRRKKKCTHDALPLQASNHDQLKVALKLETPKKNKPLPPVPTDHVRLSASEWIKTSLFFKPLHNRVVANNPDVKKSAGLRSSTIAQRLDWASEVLTSNPVWDEISNKCHECEEPMERHAFWCNKNPLNRKHVIIVDRIWE